MRSGSARGSHAPSTVLVWVFGALVVGGFLVSTPTASADAWTETSESDFLGGSLTDVTVSPGGDVGLGISDVPSVTRRGMVVDHGPPGAFDDVWAAHPSVLRESDGTYKMWYLGNDGSRYRILFADSPDGVAWTKRGVVVNVLTPPWNFDSAAGMAVIKEGTTYHMWFGGGYWTGGPAGFWAQVYYATSTDGRTLSIQGAALGLGSSGSWDDSLVSYPRVVRDPGGLYRLYYAGWDGTAGATYRTGLATSSTYTGFARYGSGPVLDVGPSGAWDAAIVAHSSVVPGSRWTMYYAGNNGTATGMGSAVSYDAGYTWTKTSGNPWFGPSSPPAWDGIGLGPGSHVSDPGGERLYYAGGDGTYYRIGYATLASTFLPSGTYVSRVFDSGGVGPTWQSIAWNATTPASTEVALSVRAGNTPVPDATWTGWSSVSGPSSGSPLTLPRASHVQYRVTLSTTNTSMSPTLYDVTITYGPNQAPSAGSLSPAGGAWVSSQNPVFGWTSSDPEGDPQVAFEVQLSLDSTFGNILSSGVTPGPAVSWQPPALGEGRWHWRVRVSDPYGAWSLWATESFGIDFTPPTTSASLTGRLGMDGWYVGPVTVSLDATDEGSGVESTTYRVDGGAWQPYGIGFAVAVEGWHVVEFHSTDLAGNSEAVQSRSLQIDLTPPMTTPFVTGELGTNGWYVGPVSVTLISADATSGVANAEFRLDGGPWEVYANPIEVAGDGPHLVEFYAKEVAGNDEAIRATSFNIDTGPPQTSALPSGTLGNNGWYRSAVSVALSAVDATSGVARTEYRIDSGPWVAYSGPFAVSGDGPHTVGFRSTDAAGLVEEVQSLQVRVDTVAPGSRALVLGEENGGVYTGSVVVDLEASDATSGVAATEYRIDGGEWQPYAGAFRVSNDGAHTLEFRSTDAAGLREEAKSVSIDIRTSVTNPGAFVDLWFLALLAVVVAAFLAVAVLIARRRRASMERPPGGQQ